jgi:hypothetical protein
MDMGCQLVDGLGSRDDVGWIYSSDVEDLHGYMYLDLRMYVCVYISGHTLYMTARHSTLMNCDVPSNIREYIRTD